jgi:hypothetical protein
MPASRYRSLFRKDRMEKELTDELQFHDSHRPDGGAET